MPRKKRTREPSGDGGPENLMLTRTDQKEKTLRSAEVIFDKLKKLGLELNEENWIRAKAVSDPKGASWRATYRAHVKHLFADLRSESARGGLSAAQAATLRDQRDRALQCVKERNDEIGRLKSRILDLEAENAKLGRGTRKRRTRRPRQDRQALTDEAGNA